MLAASPEIFDLNTLAFLTNYEDCPQCQKTGWLPSPNGRPCLHRHDEITSRVTSSLGNLIREYCRQFTTNNDGQVRLLVLGLLVEFTGLAPALFARLPNSDKLRSELHEEKLLPPQKPRKEIQRRRHSWSFCARNEAREDRGVEDLDQGGLQRNDLGVCGWPGRSELLPNEPTPARATGERFCLPVVSTLHPLKERDGGTLLGTPGENRSEASESHAQDAWTRIELPLKERVSEQNFEIWLSSVRFLSAHDQVIVLGCLNGLFQGYLTEHYKELIEEELRKAGEPRPVIFQVIERPPEPTIEEATRPAEPPKPPTKAELRLQKRLQARAEATDRKSGLNHSMLASLVAILDAADAEEDRREAEPQKAAYKEAWRDQRAKPSHWWGDEKTTPKKLRQLSEQIDRDDKKGPSRPNSS